MAGKVTLTFSDFTNEKSSFQFKTLAFNAANFNANDLLVTNLITSVGALTEGLLVKDIRVYSEAGNGQGQSSIPTAQRESKWLITYEDTVNGNRENREIPAPLLDATTILPTINGDANVTDAKWVAFIADFEAIALSKDENPITFISARHVGRNN